jgi:Flavodoxin domain
MNALVVYESVYGNTRAIGEAIAEGLGNATVLPVHEASDRVGQADLLVVGGPTHVHGMATPRSRHVGAQTDGDVHVEADATAEPCLREWLHELPEGHGISAAAFDTRLARPPILTGAASQGIAKRLRNRGYDVVASESFLVDESPGPLSGGELERAKEWGRGLAAQRPVAAATRSEA